MLLSNFHLKCRAQWVDGISAVSSHTPATTSAWRDTHAIVSAVAPFISAGNHLHFPGSGGGHDVERVTLGHEPGTIEFVISDKIVYLAKPRKMTLEYVVAAPAESFVIFDLAPLEPSGVYPPESINRWHEELVELSPGNYVERAVWDMGHNGHDAAGNEVPLPPAARLLLRIFGGRLMLVSKGSVWNSTPRTYDGRHDRMTNEQIRNMIEQSISSDMTV
jgi:serine/threonine-protein kinase